MVTEREIREAYSEIAIENSLTVIWGSDGLPDVPPHWRAVAEQRAIDNLLRS